MREIRIHGIGGEGVVTLSEMIGKIATRSGKWAHSFPFFGTEVRGAPVKAFTRVDSSPIRVKSFIYEPDTIVITNDALLKNPEVLQGLKDTGYMIVNTVNSKKNIEDHYAVRGYPINATALGQEIFGKPIVNTILLGALIRISEIIPLKTAVEIIFEEFDSAKAALNTRAINMGYEMMREEV